MTFKSFITTLVIATTLTACGGSEVIEEQSMQASAAPVAATLEFVNPPIVVRMHGDSTQKGVNPEGVNPATVSQTILTGMGRNVAVYGHGVGASDTANLLYGWDVKPMVPWDEELRTRPAHIRTIRHAINPAKHFDQETFRGHINLLIDMAEAAGEHVLLETPSPTDFITRPDVQLKIEANVRVLKEIAFARPEVTFCNHWRNGQEAGYENLSDGVHPTKYSYEQWDGPYTAECILRAIKRRAIALGDGTNPDYLGLR